MQDQTPFLGEVRFQIVRYIDLNLLYTMLCPIGNVSVLELFREKYAQLCAIVTLKMRSFGNLLCFVSYPARVVVYIKTSFERIFRG